VGDVWGDVSSVRVTFEFDVKNLLRKMGRDEFVDIADKRVCSGRAKTCTLIWHLAFSLKLGKVTV